MRPNCWNSVSPLCPSVHNAAQDRSISRCRHTNTHPDLATRHSDLPGFAQKVRTCSLRPRKPPTAFPRLPVRAPHIRLLRGTRETGHRCMQCFLPCYTLQGGGEQLFFQMVLFGLGLGDAKRRRELGCAGPRLLDVCCTVLSVCVSVGHSVLVGQVCHARGVL